MKTDEEYIKEWNRHHCEQVALNDEKGMNPTESATSRNNFMVDYCERMIVEAKKVYYNSGDNIMSDRTYDRLEDVLRYLRPDSKILEKVGS